MQPRGPRVPLRFAGQGLGGEPWSGGWTIRLTSYKWQSRALCVESVLEAERQASGFFWQRMIGQAIDPEDNSGMRKRTLVAESPGHATLAWVVNSSWLG